MTVVDATQFIRSNITGAATATAVLLYDILLTLRSEIRCIWQRKLTGPTVIFLVMRYIALAYSILNMSELILCASNHSSCTFCNGIVWATAVATALLFLGLAVFSAIRVYAISGRVYKFAGVVLVLMITGAGLLAYSSLGTIYVSSGTPLGGCQSAQQTAPIISEYIATALLIISELIVQIVTWRKTSQLRKLMAQLHMRQPRVIVLLLRDGTIGFLTLSICAMISLFTPAIRASSPIAIIALSILVCRFILSLRGVYFPADTQMTGEASRNSSIQFSAVVGNLGAPLDVRSFTDNAYRAEDEEDEDVIMISADPLGDLRDFYEERL